MNGLLEGRVTLCFELLGFPSTCSKMHAYGPNILRPGIDIRGPTDYINIRILYSGAKAHDQEDFWHGSRILWACWAPRHGCSDNKAAPPGIGHGIQNPKGLLGYFRMPR